MLLVNFKIYIRPNFNLHNVDGFDFCKTIIIKNYICNTPFAYCSMATRFKLNKLIRRIKLYEKLSIKYNNECLKIVLLKAEKIMDLDSDELKKKGLILIEDIPKIISK